MAPSRQENEKIGRFIIMDDITVSVAQLLMTYGPLGLISLYFGYKDLKLNRQIESTLQMISTELQLLEN